MRKFKIFRYRIIKTVASLLCCSEVIDKKQYDRVVPCFNEPWDFKSINEKVINDYYQQAEESKAAMMSGPYYFGEEDV